MISYMYKYTNVYILYIYNIIIITSHTVRLQHKHKVLLNETKVPMWACLWYFHVFSIEKVIHNVDTYHTFCDMFDPINKKYP